MVLFGQGIYDACWRPEPDKNGEFQQGIADLETVQEDCKVFKRCIDKFQIHESNVINLTDDTQKSRKKLIVALDNIFEKLKAGKRAKPPVNYLVIFLSASHGFLKDGIQHILLNEYRKDSEFYAMYPIEQKLRSWAEDYPNAYIVGIFACCRNVFEESCGGLISKEDKDMIVSDVDLYHFHLKKFSD